MTDPIFPQSSIWTTRWTLPPHALTLNDSKDEEEEEEEDNHRDAFDDITMPRKMEQTFSMPVNLVYGKGVRAQKMPTSIVSCFIQEYKKLLVTAEWVREKGRVSPDADDQCPRCRRSRTKHKCIWPCPSFRNGGEECTDAHQCHMLHYLPYCGMLYDPTFHPPIVFELPRAKSRKACLGYGFLLRTFKRAVHIKMPTTPTDHAKDRAKIIVALDICNATYEALTKRRMVPDRRIFNLLVDTEQCLVFGLPIRSVLMFMIS